MKKFVRGKWSRVLSLVLMTAMMVPGLILPMAIVAEAASGGRQDIILLPLQSGVKNPPSDLSGRILRELQMALVNEPGVQVNELTRTSPILKRAKEQLPDADKELLMATYDVAINPATDAAERLKAAGYLAGILGVDAVVYGSLDQYEFTTDPNPRRSYIHLTITKATVETKIDADGVTHFSPLAMPLVIRGKSAPYPGRKATQATLDAEAIANAAQDLATQLIGKQVSPPPPERPKRVDTNTAPRTEPTTVGAAPAKPKAGIPVWLLVIGAIGIAAAAGGGGGGGGGGVVNPPTIALGYAYPQANSVQLEFPKQGAMTIEYQILRTELGLESKIATIAAAQATLNAAGTMVIYIDNTVQAGHTYSYRVAVITNERATKYINIENGAHNQFGVPTTDQVGLGMPPPVTTLTHEMLGGSSVKLTWTVPNATFVRQYRIERRDVLTGGTVGPWSELTTQTATGTTGTLIVTIGVQKTYEYRVIAIGPDGLTYPVQTVTSGAITASTTTLGVATNVQVSPIPPVFDTTTRKMLPETITWRGTDDVLVSGYQLLRKTTVSNARGSWAPTQILGPNMKAGQSGRDLLNGRGARFAGSPRGMRVVSKGVSGFSPIGAVIPKNSTNQYAMTDADLADHTTYQYAVQSISSVVTTGAFTSDPSAEIFVDVPPGNVAKTSITATASDKQVVLEWAPPTLDADGSPINSMVAAGGFKVYRLTTPPTDLAGYTAAELPDSKIIADVKWVDTSAKYTYKDTAVTNRQVYYYAIVPYDSQKQKSLAPYSSASARPMPAPQGITLTGDTTVLAPGAAAQTLRILVVDGLGAGIESIPVTVALAGVGSISATSVTTDVNGAATVQYTPPTTLAGAATATISAMVTGLTAAKWAYNVKTPVAQVVRLTLANQALVVVDRTNPNVALDPSKPYFTTVQALVTDNSGQPVPGQAVALVCTDANVTFRNMTPAVTGADGKITAEVRAGFDAGTVQISGVVGTAPPGRVNLQLLPGLPNPVISIDADISAPATGTVTVTDKNGNAVPNMVVMMSTTYGSIDPSVVTNASGVASFTLRPIVQDVTAQVTAQVGMTKSPTVSVHFSIPANPELVAGQPTVVAGSTSPFTTRLRSANGTVLAATAVTATVSSGTLTVGPTTGASISLTTDADGLVTFSFNAPINYGNALLKFFDAANKQIGNTVTISIGMPAPTGLAAATAPAAPSTTINVTWNVGTGQTAYVLQRKDDVNGWVDLAPAPAFDVVSYSDKTCAPGTTYSYRLRALIVAVPGSDSPWSNIATATTAPTAPTNLHATDIAVDTITLGWDDNVTGESGYVLQRKTDTVPWADIATPMADAVTYQDTGLLANTTYYYRIAATNAGGNSSYSNILNATTKGIRAAASYTLTVKDPATSRIYFSSDPDDQLADASRLSNVLVLTGKTSLGDLATGAKVTLTTNKGNFDKAATDQTITKNVDGSCSVTGVLDSSGQMNVIFRGRRDDQNPIGQITLPTAAELGEPQFTAQSVDPTGDKLIIGKTMMTDSPKLVGPPYSMNIKPLTPPAPPLGIPQSDKWPVLFQENTLTVSAQATDIVGQVVLADMPVWFVQSWSKLNNLADTTDPEYFKKAWGHGNMRGPFGLTDETGTATAGFASNHSGVYTLCAIALRKNFDRTKLDSLNTDTAGGLNPTNIDAQYGQYMLPAQQGVMPTSLTTGVGIGANVLCKTFEFYDHWSGFTSTAKAINCDGSQTSRITFTATDEDGKKMLPGVPFRVTTNYGLLQLDNGTSGTTIVNVFDDRSMSYVLVRGNATRPRIGRVALTFDNLRTVQPIYRTDPYGSDSSEYLVSLCGPAIASAVSPIMITPEEMNGDHRIAPVGDPTVAPVLQKAHIAINMMDRNGNLFPDGYVITVVGTAGTLFSGVLGEIGGLPAVRGIWETDYTVPMMAGTEVDDQLTITITGPTFAGDGITNGTPPTDDTKNTWTTNTTITTERPNSATFTDFDGADGKTIRLPYSTEYTITASTFDVGDPNRWGGAKRPMLAGYPISFQLVKTVGADTATLTPASVTTNGLGEAAVKLATGTTYGTVVVKAFYQTKLLGQTAPIIIGIPKPAGLTVTPVVADPNAMQLAWTAGTGLTAYQVLRSPAGKGVWQQVGADLPATQTTFTDTELLSSTQYDYEILAINDTTPDRGIVQSWPSDITTNFTSPEAPGSDPDTHVFLTFPTATAVSPTQIDLKWDDVPREGGYIIERKDIQLPKGTLGPWVKVGATAADVVTFSDKGLTPGTQYQYQIKATNAAGLIGGPSMPTSPELILYTFPAAPPTLTAKALSSTKIELAWGAIAGETGFRIERSDDNILWTVLTDPPLAVDTKVYDDDDAGMGLKPNTLYYYRVVSINDSGESTSLVQQATKAEPPANVTAVPVNTTSVTISWDAVDSATGYKVQRTLDPLAATPVWTGVGGTLGATVLSYTNTGLTAATTYYYRVITVNASGDSLPSAPPVAVTTYTNGAATISATPISDTEIDLSWSPTIGADYYMIERTLDKDAGPWVSLIDNSASASYKDTTCLPGTTYYYRITPHNAAGYAATSAPVSALTYPSMVTGLVLTPRNATTVDVRWTAAPGAATYVVQKSLTGTVGDWVEVAKDLTGTTYSDDKDVAATKYWYRVLSYNKSGTMSGTPMTATVTTFATTPTNPKAVANSASQITVTWDAVVGATSYKVERSPDGVFGWTQMVPDPTISRYVDTGLTDATQYFYRVSATTPAGSSATTAVVNATTYTLAPTGVTLTAVSPTQIDVRWAMVNGATDFIVERSLTGDPSDIWTITDTKSVVRAYSDTTCLAGTRYYYRVRAVNAAGNSDPSTVVNLITVPGKPINLAANTASASTVNLTWSAVTGAVTLTVERSLTGTGGWTVLDNSVAGTATTYTDATCLPVTQYFYRITAVNTTGTSVPSDPKSTTTYPTVPTNFSGTALSSTKISLKWDIAVGATGYKIERSLDPTFAWTSIANVTPNTTTTYVDTGCLPGTKYYYRVTAYITDPANGNATGVINVTTPLDPPTALAGVADSATQVTLNWTASVAVGVTGYEVQRTTTPAVEASWTTIAPLVTGVTYTDNNAGAGLTPGTAYSYRIRAIASLAVLNSLWTAPATVTTAPAAPTLAAIDPTQDVIGPQVTLNWNVVPTAVSYVLQRSADGGTTWPTENSVTGITYADTGSPDTLYSYRVAAKNAAGAVSAWSAVRTATTGPNSPVASLNATADGVSVSLTWPNVVGLDYRLERKTMMGTWGVVAASLPANVPSYLDISAALQPNTTYLYRIATLNAAGAHSAWTQSAPVTTGPSAALTLQPAQNVTSTSLTFAWGNVTGETGYELYRWPIGSTQPATPTATLPADTTATVAINYADSGLTPGQTYYYRVAAVNAAGRTFSNIRQVTMIPPVPVALAAAATDTTITLTWTDGIGETNYEMQRRVKGAAWPAVTVVTTIDPDTATYDDAGLAINSTFEYRMRAINAAGKSAWTTNVVSASTIPAVPTLSSIDQIADVSGPGVVLRWNTVTTATTYTLQRSADGGATWPFEQSVTATIYNDTGLADTQYSYRLAAKNAAGTSDWSVVRSTTTGPNAQVTSLTGVADGTAITLTWPNVAGLGYRLERKQVGGAYTVVQANLPANLPTYTDASAALAANTTYVYRIATVNASGSHSVWTDSSPITTGPVSALILQAPTNITTTTLTLTWDNVANEARYELYRWELGQTQPAGPTATIPADTSAALTVSTNDSGLIAGQTYYYRVAAVTAAGVKTFSNIQQVSTIPPVPANFKGTIAGTTATLTWTDGIGETSYELQSRVKGAAWPADTVVTTIGENAVTVDAESLTPSTTYEFRLRAVNVSGKSPWSNTVGNLTTQPAAPVLSAIVALTDVDGDRVTLHWAAVPTAVTYTLERSQDGGATWTTVKSGIAGISYTDDTGTPDIQWTFRLSATNASGTSDWSGTRSVTTGPNTPVATLNAVANGVVITLTWPNVAGLQYRLERKASTTGVWTLVNAALPANLPSYIDNDPALTANSTYQYRIATLNAVGSRSTWTVSPFVTTGPSSSVTLQAPTNVLSTTLSLNWDNVAGETGYEVYRWIQGSAQPATPTATLPADTTAAVSINYNDTGLTPGQTYNYCVAAINAAGRTFSNIQQVTMIPAVPAALAASATGTTVTLTWTDGIGETSYELQRRAKGAAWPADTVFTIIAPESATFDDAGLAADSTFEYRLRAVNDSGKSAWTTNLVSVATIPAVPTLSAIDQIADVTGPTVIVRWSAVTTATGYELQRSADGGLTWPFVQAVAGIVYSDTATADTQYAYRVAAKNAAGTSDWSAVRTTTTGPNGQVASLTGIADGTAITLSWPLVAGMAYRLERKPMGGSYAVVQANLPANLPQYTDASAALLPNSTYVYRIATVNASGSHSAWMESAPITTGAAAALNLQAPTSVTATTLSIAWDNVANESRYELYRWALGQTQPGTPTDTLPADTSAAATVTFADSGLTAGQTYYYRVAAVTPAGVKTFSNIQQVSMIPPTPAGLAATVAGTTATLTWADGLGETGYELQQRIRGSAWPATTVVTAIGQNVTTIDVDSLTPSTIYEFRLRAVNASGNSPWTTAVVSITTAPATPVLAPIIAMTDVNGDQVTLRWALVPNAATYTLQRSLDGTIWVNVKTDLVGITYTDDTATPDTAFSYRLAAVNPAGTSDWSAVQSTTTGPNTPVNALNAVADGVAITLTWTNVPGLQYRLERKASSMGTWTLVNASLPANLPSYLDADAALAPNSTYQYRIATLNPAGSRSAWTISGFVTTGPAASLTLQAPTNVTATTLTLTWDNITGESGYELYRWILGQTQPATPTATFPADATAAVTITTNETGLTSGQTYYYRIAGVTAAGKTFSNIQQITTIPPTPTNLQATSTGTTVTLTWNDVLGDNGYELQRRVTGSAWPADTVVTSIAQDAVTIDDAGVADTSYEYRLRSVNATGKSAWTTTVVTASTLPAVPAGVTITMDTDPITAPDAVQLVTVSWTDDNAEQSYEIQRSPDGVTSWATVGTTTKDTVVFTQTGFTSPIEVAYRVRAINGAGNSDWSSVVAMMTGPTWPSPGGLTKTVVTSTAVTLSWNDSDMESGFEAWMSTDAAGFIWTKVADVTPNVNTYTYTGLGANEHHWFRVRPYYTDPLHPAWPRGYAGWTNKVDQQTAPAQVLNMTATTQSSTDVKLLWDPTVGAAAYEVQWKKGTTGNYTMAPVVLEDPQTMEGAQVTYTVTGLTPNTLYSFRVRAVNGKYGDKLYFGKGDWSTDATATTSQGGLISSFRAAVKTGKPTSIYYSADPDEQLADSTPLITDVVVTGMSAGIPAANAQIVLKTDRGYFVDDTFLPVQYVKTLTRSLDGNGQVTVKFQGRYDDLVTKPFTVPASTDLGTPILSATDQTGNPLDGGTTGWTTGSEAKLIGPPARVSLALYNVTATGGTPVLFQEKTATVIATVTDMIGQSVLDGMPIWFTQAWDPFTGTLNDPNATTGVTYYQQAVAEGNIRGAYGLTAGGTVAADFASNHSGLYTLEAFGLLKSFSKTDLDQITNLNNPGAVNYAQYLLPSDLGGYVTNTTPLMSKTLVYYDHWFNITSSKAKINCDGTETATITFTATDEDGKKVLPGVPFDVKSSLGLLEQKDSLGNTIKSVKANVWMTNLTFDQGSSATLLSRGDITNLWIGHTRLTFNNHRAVQSIYGTGDILAFYGPALALAVDWAPGSDGVNITPYDDYPGQGRLHRLAGWSDAMRTNAGDAKKSATVSLYLHDSNGNAFPGGYTINIGGYGATTGTNGRASFTYNAPDLNGVGTDEYMESVIVRGISATDDNDQRTNWGDKDIITERPNNGTMAPKFATPAVLPFNTNVSISLATRDTSGRTIQPGYPITFKIDRPLTQLDNAKLNGNATQAVVYTENGTVNGTATVTLNTGTVTGTITVIAYYDRNRNNVMDAGEKLDDSGTIILGLASPTVVASASTLTDITLTWADGADETGYAIKYASASTGPWTLIDSGDGLTTVTADTTTYTDSGLPAGSTRYYQVYAVTTNGVDAATGLPMVVTSLLPPATTSFTLTPSAPASPTLTANSTTAIKVDWTAVTYATSYKIERSLTGLPASWTTVQASTTLLTYTDNGLTANTKYYYRVYAYNGTYSSPSIASSRYTLPDPLVNTPTGIGLSSSSIKLTWATVAGAAGYSIERYNTATSAWDTITAVPVVGGTYTDASGLNPGTNYRYRIFSVNGDTPAARSLTSLNVNLQGVGGVDIPTIPSEPVSLNATPITGPSRITVTWTPPAPAGQVITGYTLTRLDIDGANAGKTTQWTYGSGTMNMTDSTSIVTGVSYRYSITANNNSGSSVATSSIVVTAL